ncbi:MAG: glutathione S-transferase N-terminal domain-containing protein [Myxococcales bacterium]|nr:glutathione S-transferase N-terminal domain-containing protein [Myxococcales bacterium]
MTGTRAFARMMAIIFLGTLCGCDQVLTWLDELDHQEAPDPAGAETPALAEEEEVSQRPADSIARSETEVITFRNILQNEEMSREERIQALLNLDPAALQAPGSPNRGASDQPTQGSRPQAREKGPKQWEIANARRHVPVVMYSTTWCGVCKKARRYFEDKRISFVEYDVDKNASARAEYLSLNPRRTVPTIKVGNEVIVGFSEAAVGRALEGAARARLN